MNSAVTASENTQSAGAKYILRVLNLIHEPGSVVELRCPNTQKGTISGYFDDFTKLSDIAADLSGKVPGVYATLNPVNPDLLARANNRIENYAKRSSGDADIVNRCWLPIDFDPVRPADISSTDVEKALALERAKECRTWLTEMGFPAAVFGDSGNGAHLLYRIDLPNDAAATELIKKCLEGMAARFTDDKVAVDLKNFNAARIWKLYGTLACKGDNMLDRPHRQAKILEGKNLGVVSVELLQTLASFAPEPEKPRSNGHYQPFNVDEFIARHGIPVKREKCVSYGRLLILEACAFNPDHNHGEAHITAFTSGAVGYACKHNSCAFKKWQDVRELYEPGYRERNDQHYTGAGSKEPKEQPAPEDEDPIAPQTVPFPGCAWVGPFEIWRDVVCPTTEAPAEYLWASCLIVVGLILGRRVVVRNPRPLYPNFYVLLLGQTGDDRKSTALDYAGDAIFHAGLDDEIQTMRGIQSAEAIYESLSRHEGAKSLGYSDEFRSLMAVAKRKGTQDLIPRLGSLYYCPRKDNLNRRHSKESTEIVNPFFSLISATPLEYVHDLVGDLEVDGGFVNRFLPITGKVQSWKAIAPPPTVSQWQPFKQRILDIGAYYSAADCELAWDKDAAALWTEFYTAWKTSRQEWNTRDQKLTARIDEHVLKLAMLYSAIEKKRVLTREAFVVAISIGKWLQSIALDAFSDLGQDRFAKCETKILEALRLAKKRCMWRRDLQRRMSRYGFNGEIFNRAIKALEANEHIRCDRVTTSAGKYRQAVALCV